MTGRKLAGFFSFGLVLCACSGQVGVGFEPVDEGVGGSSGSSGNSAKAGSGGGQGLAGQSVAGSMPGGGPGPGPDTGLCDFGSVDVADDPRPLLSSAEVLARIYRFLDDDASIPAGALPAEPTANWAAGRAKAILDAHVAADTAAPGLERFLRHWLAITNVDPDAEPASPGIFARKLVDRDATLATLLAEPTGEPHRFDILTEPEFLSAYSTSSRRGVWMVGNLICQEVPPPPPEVQQELTGPGITHRQRLESGLSMPQCQGCHALFDPPGYSLEHFDDVGDYRDLDNGEPVDASATMQYPSMSFEDFSELAPQLATSCEVAHCMARLLTSDALGQPLHPVGMPLSEAEINLVAENFAESGFSIRKLVESIVRSPSFLR